MAGGAPQRAGAARERVPRPARAPPPRPARDPDDGRGLGGARRRSAAQRAIGGGVPKIQDAPDAAGGTAVILGTLQAFFAEHQADLIARTLQHLELVALALLAATLFGFPLAVLLRHNRPASSAFLGFAGIVQTVPSLAL